MTGQPQAVHTRLPVPSRIDAASGEARRAQLTVQRSARRVTLHPKYGRGPVAVDVRYLWTGAPDAPTVVVQGGISADRDVVTSPAAATNCWPPRWFDVPMP